MKIKVLNIVDEFHPQAGYENNILSKFMVKLGYDYEILTTHFTEGDNYINFLSFDNIDEKDKKFTEGTGVKVTRLSVKRKVSGRAVWNFKEFLKTVDMIKPDVLFFCGNDSLIFIQYILKFKKEILRGTHKYKIIADSHMLDMASKNKFKNFFYSFYRHFVTPILIKASIKVIRVQNDTYVNRRLGIPLEQCPFLSFGTDTSIFHKDDIQRKKTRVQLGIPNESFVVLYAGKINESKGGMLLAESLKEEYKATDGKQIVFLILANASSDYEQNVLDVLKASDNKVIIRPAVPYVDLPEYYKATDLAIFPKQCSLSFYDLQACGVPVVLENNNINCDRVSNSNGFIFDGTKEGLRDQLQSIFNMDSIEEYSQSAIQYIRENYDYGEIAKEYDIIFKELMVSPK